MARFKKNLLTKGSTNADGWLKFESIHSMALDKRSSDHKPFYRDIKLKANKDMHSLITCLQLVYKHLYK